MRVIAGKYRSRPLHSLPGLDLRPTSERLRETLFDVLTAGNPAALEHTVWLDLFAGTGAVGIEAISRGAEMVYFIESSRPAAELIREICTRWASKPASGFSLRMLSASDAPCLMSKSILCFWTLRTKGSQRMCKLWKCSPSRACSSRNRWSSLSTKKSSTPGNGSHRYKGIDYSSKGMRR